MNQDDARTEAAVWQAMVLFSTLTTAAEVWRAALERRAGHDPSEQEAEAVVVPHLRRASGELQALLMRLQASRIQAERGDEGRMARLVRRYHDLTGLRRVAHMLQIIHQRLLSLYPHVSELLIEEARLLQGYGSTLLEAEDEAFRQDIGLFLHRGLVFTGDLHQALHTPF